jgi:hypothetical protein
MDVFACAGVGSDELPRCCFVYVESAETVPAKCASLNSTSLYSVLVVGLSFFLLFSSVACINVPFQ